MNKIFVTNTFLYFILPLMTVLLNIFLKVVSRNDRNRIFKKEDIAVGLEISTSSLIIFLTYCGTIATGITPNLPTELSDSIKEKLISAPWIILSLILGLWGISTIVRLFGWKYRDTNNEDSNYSINPELNWPIGIIVPFIYGILSLYFVLNWLR
jgi:hypothetical protein